MCFVFLLPPTVRTTCTSGYVSTRRQQMAIMGIPHDGNRWPAMGDPWSLNRIGDAIIILSYDFETLVITFIVIRWPAAAHNAR